MNTIDRKKIKREMILLIIPIIIESILQISAGLVSTAMVGRLLATDVAAQGACIRVTDTLWCFYKGISIGATVMIAKSHGMENRSECRHIAKQTLMTELPIALFFAVLLMFNSMPVIAFFNDDASLLLRAQEYMQIIVFGFPFVVIMSVVTASFQGCGDTKTPMLIAVAMNITNILVGWILIFGVGSVPELGIRGAAMALVIAQGTAAGLGLFLLYRRGGLFGGVKKHQSPRRLDLPCVQELYALGVPAAMESVFWQMSAILLSKMIFSYGESAFAAYQIGIQAETITEMPAVGFGTAATTLVARAVGKNDDRLRDVYVKELTILSLQISVVTSLLLIVFPTAFMHAMTTIEVLVPIGALYVFIMGFIQIPQNLSRVYNGVLRAVGFKRAPMIIAGVGIWGVRIPLCFVVSALLKWDIVFIWLIIAADQVMRFVLCFGLYHWWRKKQNVRDSGF